jgi:alpha-galactosidase
MPPSSNTPPNSPNPANAAVAAALSNPLDREGFPSPREWQRADPIVFCADWQGKNADAQRETQVRLLWTPATLFLQFRARYRELTVFPDASASGRRDHLWDRDVAEVFLQPDPRQPLRYAEFEVSPNAFWIDLDINLDPAAERLRDLRSGLARRVRLDEAQKLWSAELSIPMRSLTARFDPAAAWRVNFFRVEGPREPRFYSSWQPTHTPEPNFHVPQAFGKLLFAPPRAGPGRP